MPDGSPGYDVDPNADDVVKVTKEDGTTTDPNDPSFEDTGTGILGNTQEQIESTYTDAGGAAEDQTTATSADQAAYDAEGTADTISRDVNIGSGEDAIGDQSLVATQLDQILGKDSPLLRRAGARGEVDAAKRGQLGSSMGIGAAQGAMYGQAFDIASQDAATYGKADLQAQNARNQVELTKGEGIVAGSLASQAAAHQERSQAFKHIYDTAREGASQETAALLQDNQRQWDEKMQQHQLEFDEWNTNTQIDAGVKEALAQRRATSLENHQIATSQLLGDPAFLEMDVDAQANILNTMADGVMASVRFDMVAAGVSEEELGWLDDLADDLYFEFA